MNAVLFDFGGTLDSDGQTWIDRFYVLYKEAGLDVPRERFNRAFYDCDDTLAQRHDLRELSLEATVQLQVGRVVDTLAPGRGDLGRRVAREFVEGSRAVLRRNAAVLGRLASRYRLGVVSNFYGNLEAVLASEDLRRYFSAVADSAVVGRIKPDAAIFEHALGQLGCRAQDCVMVGDSITRDMRGAEALRMRHALIGGNGASCCAEAWRIKTLPELEALL